MKKKMIGYLLVLLAAVSLLGGCFLNIDLADSFDQQQVIEQGKAFVALINEGDYDGCAALFSDSMKTTASADDLKSLVEQKVENPGAFVSFTDATVSGTSQDGQDYAVCLLLAKYENKEKVQYNVTFDSNMKVAGFYCK